MFNAGEYGPVYDVLGDQVDMVGVCGMLELARRRTPVRRRQCALALRLELALDS